MRKIRIGITINISDAKESIFSNGIRQNIIILRELFEKCGNVEKAYIVNVTDVRIDQNSDSPLSRYASNIINIKEVQDKCDLIVVCHGSLLPEEYAKFALSGIRIVKLALGAQQSIFTETVLFKPNEKAFGIYTRNKHVKNIWTSPHFYDNEKYFHEALFDCEVLKAPYVWDPRFIEEYADIQKKTQNVDSLYKPSGEKAKRLGTFEPNINYVKSCVIPTIISEKFYRKYPDLLKFSYIYNTKEIRSKKDFVQFCKDLDSHINGKLFFQDSFAIMHALPRFTDILLSHQDGCALNYLYLDAAWFGYPVVHNSHLMKELGWYYPEYNVDIAVEHVKNISENFDSQHEKYLAKSRKYAEKYFITNKKNIKGFELLIEGAMK
jgi:hypothetical protein